MIRHVIGQPIPPPKHIAADFYIGSTHVMISDDYCVKTQEEVDAILKRIARNSTMRFVSQRCTADRADIS